jgi:ATP-dependent Clp protease ATP-binding subunit ClpA
MFERYTEKARRVVFFARYEASQFGSPYIETEHLLLGLLREDKALANRFLQSYASVESIRRKIEEHTTVREQVSTSVDLPLSNECKRILAYAAEEAERLGHKYIGTEHLLLGLLREEKCVAAELLSERGLRLSAVREEVARVENSFVTQTTPKAWDLANVTITSMPAGADIQVDDAFLGHTPAQVSLEVGERTVTITKTGYKPWQRRLRVLPGSKQTIAAQLEQFSANS